MKAKTFLIGFILIVISQSVFSQNDFKFPERQGFVNDFEGVFSNEQISKLNEIIKNHEDLTSNQIVIVSIKSFAPFVTLFDYSLKLANYWGIGQKDKNNGIAIVFGKQIRQIRIQVGSGLEKKLQDKEVQNIIDNIIIAEFKKGNFYEGILSGLLQIIKKIE